MELEEFIKIMGAAGYHISIEEDSIISAISYKIIRGDYMVSGYVKRNELSQQNTSMLLNILKEAIQKLDAGINSDIDNKIGAFSSVGQSS